MCWRIPRSVPTKTLGYAKYDLVRAFNEVVEALGLSESMLERVLAKAIAVPASRFLRMKRGVNLLISDRQASGHGRIVEGTYQSTILVQWRAVAGRVRHVDATLYNSCERREGAAATCPRVLPGDGLVTSWQLCSTCSR